MMKGTDQAPKYRIAIFIDDEATKKFLVKLSQKRGYEVSSYAYPEECPALDDPKSCICTKTKSCADILILGRHFSTFKALDFLEAQIKAGCKLTIKNKLVLVSSFEPDDNKRARDIGVKMLHMPVSFNELNAWLDECEERLKKS